MPNNQKHQNYDILNLIGYGLSKFNMDFVKIYGFDTKTKFYEYIVSIGIAETTGTVKNRQDRFDGMNPESQRKGWWQDGNRTDYKFRKDYIDSLFGNLDAKEFVDIVKLSIAGKLTAQPESYKLLQRQESEIQTSPIVKTRFKQMQETGIEAEYYFLNNYMTINTFATAKIEDARLFGDGYDFQLSLSGKYYLAEVKGLKADSGNIRLTKNEYEKAVEYTNDYALIVVSNLVDIPKMVSVLNPVECTEFEQHKITSEQIYYTSRNFVWR